MNEYIEYNLAKAKKNNADLHGWSFNRSCGFKCTSCGKEVSPAVVKFYGEQVDRLKCYDCQKKPTF